MSEHLLLRLAKQNSSREMYSPIRHIKKIKNTSAFLTPDGDLVSKALVFFIFFMCRRIGEYISLELFCFVNLTSSCSFIPLGNKVILYRIVLYHIVLCCIVYHDCLDVREADSSLV